MNTVRKIAQVTEELGIQWKSYVTERNLTDIRSRSASLKKMGNNENGRLNNEREHAWGHWQRKYINSLMKSHRINHGKQQIPGIEAIILVVGEQKNRWEWMKDRVIHHVKGRDPEV